MEGKQATKRPNSAIVTSSSTARTPFTRFVPQTAFSSGRQAASLPPTTTAFEPHVPPRHTGAATPHNQSSTGTTTTTTTTRGPRSIAQLRSLNREEQEALIQGKVERRKPPLQRALSFPGRTAVEGTASEHEDVKQLMRGLRQCRYLRTSQENAIESEDD